MAGHGAGERGRGASRPPGLSSVPGQQSSEKKGAMQGHGPRDSGTVSVSDAGGLLSSNACVCA